jgi:hypothetical protein
MKTNSSIQTTLKEKFEELHKLEEEKEKIFEQTLNGWRHTLDEWGYWMKIDFVMSLLSLVTGIFVGLIWGGFIFK